MKKRIDQKLFKFYAWVGFSYLVLAVCSDLAHYRRVFLLSLLNNTWLALYIVVLNFILFEYTVPFLGRKRKYVIYKILLILIISWVHLVLYAYGLYVWKSIGIALHIYNSLKTFASTEEDITNGFGYSIGSVFFFGIIRHIYTYVKLKQTTQQLVIQKQQAELNYLRSQTNPHFLFNTLNNIYSLARDKNDLAPESILRLSKILRYMLYETGGKYIAIEQELKIVTDYIALEKLRYDDSLRINFNYDIEDMKQALPPLLLIPLVENAFKHGVSETRNQPFVDIHLSVNKRQLSFFVRNSSEGSPGDGKVKENIGLSNLRRQLELLYTEYDLSIQQKEFEFIATLKINLATHV